MVGNRRIRFVIVLDSCCISIGLVFIKDRPVSSFWVLRFRDLGVFVFEFWVLRFRDRVLRFRSRVLRFRDLGTSCFGLRFRVLRFRYYHAAWHLSLGSYHTETHHYSPLVLRMKMVTFKFLVTITTLKIQSDCFGIKRSRKRPTDFSLQRTLPIYSHPWR